MKVRSSLKSLKAKVGLSSDDEARPTSSTRTIRAGRPVSDEPRRDVANQAERAAPPGRTPTMHGGGQRAPSRARLSRVAGQPPSTADRPSGQSSAQRYEWLDHAMPTSGEVCDGPEAVTEAPKRQPLAVAKDDYVIPPATERFMAQRTQH